MSSRRLEASAKERPVNWSLLPATVWDDIISYLDCDDRSSLRLSCSAFHNAVECSTIWRKQIVCFKGVGHFSRSTWTKLRGRRISSVCMERCTSVRDIQEILTNIPTIHTLHSRGVDNAASLLQRAPEKLFKHIAHFLVVNPYNCNTASGILLSNLNKMENLHTLKLRFFNNNVVEAHINFLSYLPKLEIFELHLRHPLNDSSVLQQAFHKLPRLRHVYLHGVQDDMSRIFLGSTSSISQSGTRTSHSLSLESLRLSENLLRKLRPLSTDAIRSLSSLRTLKLCFVNHWPVRQTLQFLSDVKKYLTHLRTFTMVLSCEHEDGFEQCLGNMPSTLTSLEVILISNERLNVVENITDQLRPKLSYLGLTGYKGINSDIAKIPDLFPNLTECSFFYGKDKLDSELLCLAKLSKLHHLTLAGLNPSEYQKQLEVLTERRVHVSARFSSRRWPVWYNELLFG